MGLLKGNYQPVEQQAANGGMSAEDERLQKRAAIVFKLRRWWRIYMIAMWVLTVAGCTTDL